MHRKSVGFKTITITCLALALISTISLNIIRTYSINNTRTNALGDSNLGSSSATTSQGSAATLANDPNYISISLSNATGSSEPTSGNISITTPTGGGIATGSHTITIHTSSIVSGYNVTLHSSGGDTDLVPSDFGKGNNNLIKPAGGSANPAPLTNPTTLANNQWGVALPGSTLYPNKYSNTNDYTSTNQTTLANTKYAAIPGKGSSDDQGSTILAKNSPANQATGDSTTIYYGVKVSPSIQADTYSAEVTYTATAILPPAPELTKLVLNDSVQQNQTNEFAIEGTNLDTVYDVWIDYNDNGIEDANEKATNVTTYPNTNKASTIISFTNPNPTSNTVSPGTYDVYVVGQGGTSKPLTNAFIVQEESICRNGDPNSDCQVDIDDNMIPIAYDEADQQWNIVTDNDLTTTSSWYDYTNKQWANAVTLRDDYEAGAVCVSVNLTPPYGYMFSVRDIHSADYNDISKIIRPETLNPEVDFGMVGFRGDTRILDVVVSLDGSCATNRETLRYTPLAYARMAKAGMTLGEGINGNTYQVNFNGSQYDDLFNNSILGYWVYIPRYAYEVQRPNAIDRVVTDEYPLPDNVNITGDNKSPYNKHSIRNEFSIHFEKATDTKKTPAETCNTLNPTKEQMWANGAPTNYAGPDNTNILAKDYRTGCAAQGNTNNISRLYTDANTTVNNTTWATHPAFTFGSTELNGLWVGKFETTGTVTNPTVKPNQHANVSEYIGEFYTMARSIGTGTYDPTNNGGNTILGIAQNSHNLSTATSHMLKNSEWGAITYLASSKYGAGTNNVSINSAYPSKSADADIASPSSSYRYGTTGCGPNNINRSTTTYTDGTPLSASTIESATACSTDPELGSRRAYNGDIGQLASTTNNVYGIYDMSGGAHEYVMGNLTGYDDQSDSSSTIFTRNPIKPPYVDLYKESPYGNFTSGLSGTTNNPVAWSNDSSESLWNNDICTWGTCGGHALHETKQYQSVSGTGQSWGGDYSGFVNSGNRWFRRGGYAYNGSSAGLFYSGYSNGGANGSSGFRSVLLAAP